MMSVFAIAPCLGCNRVFSFNPMLVPSVILAGVPRFVCKACLDRFNGYRGQIGLPMIEAPPGAYEDDAT